MNTTSDHAHSVLNAARSHWGSGPDAGSTVALVGVGLALLAIHELLEERLPEHPITESEATFMASLDKKFVGPDEEAS